MKLQLTWGVSIVLVSIGDDEEGADDATAPLGADLHPEDLRDLYDKLDVLRDAVEGMLDECFERLPQEVCPACNGSGRDNMANMMNGTDCPNCEARGRVLKETP